VSKFNFKKEATVYIVVADKQYQIDVSAVSFGQTFTEHSYSSKTLQNTNQFEQSVINKANPASFSITFPALKEGDLRVLFNKALDYNTFDIYVETEQDLYKIDTCVITKAVFILNKYKPLSIKVEGEGTKVTIGNTLPTTSMPRYLTRSYIQLTYVNLNNDTSFSEKVSALTIELSNNIVWTKYDTVNDAIKAENASSSMYPSTFTVANRELSGTITRLDFTGSEYSEDTPLFVRVGESDGLSFYGFELDLANTAQTSHMQVGDVISRVYKWRLTQNPDSLFQVFSYLGYAEDPAAILDSWGISLLDHLGEPILESV